MYSTPSIQERESDKHDLSDVQLVDLIKNEQRLRHEASMKRSSTQYTWVWNKKGLLC